MTYLERRAASRFYKSQDAANAQHPGKGHGFALVEELLARCDLRETTFASVPVEVWQIVCNFATGPIAERRAAAPTLDEFVQQAVGNSSFPTGKDVYDTSDLFDLRAVKETSARLSLLGALRTISTEWRRLADSICGSEQRLTFQSDTCLALPPDFSRRFGGCEAFMIHGSGENFGPVLCGHDSLPAALENLSGLRALYLVDMIPLALPRVLGTVPLVELCIHYADEDVCESLHYTHPCRAWESDPGVLPRSIEVLNFGADDVTLECLRDLPRLRELHLGTRNKQRHDVAPVWFHELTSLRRFEVCNAVPAEWASQLRCMRLEAVTFILDPLFNIEISDVDPSDDFGLFVDAPCGDSLAEFRLQSSVMLRAPACLRGFPHLRHLDLSGSDKLKKLPENLGRLPLVILNLNCTKVRDLPASLRETTTLRLLELQLTWLSAPCKHMTPDDVVLPCGGFCTVIRHSDDDDDAAFEDEIARRDAILTPLSLAIPELRFMLHVGRETWWHARCGWHWSHACPLFHAHTTPL